MSATSSLGRRTTAGLHSGSPPRSGQWREPVERAGQGADSGVGDARENGRGVELGMAKKHLDDADIGVLFQQMRGKVVP